MEFVKRSHLVQLEHEETYDKTNLLSRGQEVVWDQEPEPEEVGVDLLRPGEFSLHHIRLAHMSGPNNSENRRLGMAIRYMPTWSRSVLRDGIGVMLARGVDVRAGGRHGRDGRRRPRGLCSGDEGARELESTGAPRVQALTIVTVK